jgi:hypothetical protein
MAYNRRTKHATGREGRRSNASALVPASGAERMDGIVAASNDTGERIRHLFYESGGP